MLANILLDPIFLLLAACFIVQFIILLLSYKKESVRPIDWLYAEDKTVPKARQYSWLQPIKNTIRIAFSATEAEMKRKFVASGFYNSRYAIYYMPAKYLMLVLGLIMWIWLSEIGQWQVSNTILICAIWVVFALILPDMYLTLKTRQLQKSVSVKLPYMIDLLAVCVQTGMTIESSLNYLSKEMKDFDPDLGFLMNRTRERMQVVGLEQALDEMFDRVPSNEMRSFVMTLKQSIQYGSSIYEVLTNLSSEIRAVQMLSIEEKIGKLAAKMSVPLILFIMFPIVILIAAPGVMRMIN
jgi:tight adherence protein C